MARAHRPVTTNVIRVVGDDHEPRQFSTWAAIAVAIIGRLPATLDDRSIEIPMKRRGPGEHVEKFRRKRLTEFADLASMAARWASDNGEVLRKVDPDIPAELHDRAADNWEFLLATADIVGGDWPMRARAAAVALSGFAEEETARVQVLADIHAIFADRNATRLPSTTICEVLAGMEDRPWPEWKNSKPITARQLAVLLKPFRIKPRARREGGDVFKGYHLDDFKEAFSSYLPSDDRLHGYNPQKTSENRDSDRLHASDDVTDRNPLEATESATCNRVTDRKGGAPEEAPISPGNGEAPVWEEEL